MSQFVTSRTFYGGSGSQTLDIQLPYPDKVDVYTITNSNATKWKLEGTNDNGATWSQLDSQSFQQKLKPTYPCSNPGTFARFKFTFLQSQNSANVYVNGIRLQNKFYQNITPNLNSVSNTYTCVLTNGLDSVAPVFGADVTSVINGPTLMGRQYLQSNIYANVVCAHVRVTKPFEALVGSIDNGKTWSNVLARNSNVSSNLSQFNSFRVVSDNLIDSTFELYDPDGNILNSNNPERGGSYTPMKYINPIVTINRMDALSSKSRLRGVWSVACMFQETLSVPIIQLQDSTGTIVEDFYGTTTGTSLKTSTNQTVQDWMSTNSISIAYVKKWYDQSKYVNGGTAYDATGVNSSGTTTPNSTFPALNTLTTPWSVNNSTGGYFTLPNGTVVGNGTGTFSARVDYQNSAGGIIGAGTNSYSQTHNLRWNGQNGFWNYWYANDVGINSPSISKPAIVTLVTFNSNGSRGVYFTGGSTSTVYTQLGYINGTQYLTTTNRTNWQFVPGNDILMKTTADTILGSNMYWCVNSDVGITDSDRLIIENENMSTIDYNSFIPYSPPIPSGEYIDLKFNTQISANVYEFTTTGTKFPTAWSVYGSNDLGSNWTLLDQKSNVYDAYTRFTWPFSQGVIPYSLYRFIIQSFKGRSSAELVSFNLFNDRGYRLIPPLTNISVNVPQSQRPHNVYESPIITSPSTSPVSPFIDGRVFISSTSNGQFSISFPTAVSVHKIYMETNTPSFIVFGSQTDTYNTIVSNVPQRVPSNTYPTSNTYCFRNFLFSGIGKNCFVSNVMLFNSNGGRINPYMSSSTTVSSNTFGGPVNGQPITIQVGIPASYANAYAIRLQNQTLSKWTIDSNINGTWTQIETSSNAYNLKNFYFQNTFNRHETTGIRININELKPSKEDTNKVRVLNFNILGNVYTSSIPTPAIFLYSSEPGPLRTSMQGVYRISSSKISQSASYTLFDNDMGTEYSVDISRGTTTTTLLNNSVQIRGEWVEVQTPFPTRINAFGFTVPSDPVTTPTRWMLLGSTNQGVSWSNVLSNQSTSDYFTSVPLIQNTNVFSVSNTSSEFTNFRFVFQKAYNGGSLCNLKGLYFIGPTTYIVPTYKNKDAPALVHTWNTYEDISGDIYGGSYTGSTTTNIYPVANQISNVIPGEWIQLAFPENVQPAYIRLTGSTIPRNLYIVASQYRFRTTPSSETSCIIASIQNNLTQSTQITLPTINVTPPGFKYFRIITSANESSSGTVKFSEIAFLNASKRKMHQSFTVDSESDPLNQTYTVVSQNELGGDYQTSPEYIEANLYPSSMISNSYIFRSIDASAWSVTASTNYTTWDVLDTRDLTSQPSTVSPPAYVQYYTNQTGNAYSWYRVSINKTFKTTDGCVRVNEFAPLDYKQDRIIKYTTGNAYSGGSYTGFSYLQTRLKNYYGEYKTFQFERPVPISNAILTFDQTASIKGITFLGKNTEQYWNVIQVVDAYSDDKSECVDKTLTGTYIFSGTTESSASNAFTTSPYCVINRNIGANGILPVNTYIQVELPRPTIVGYYKITIPSTNDIPFDFSKPTYWTVGGSNDGSTWVTLHTVANDINLNYNDSYTYTVSQNTPYKYIRFTIQRVNEPYAALISQFILYDTTGFPLYQPKIFTRDSSVQNIDRYPLYMGPSTKFKFTNQVMYSNIAFVIQNITSDPYKSSGKLQITNTDFEPTRFVGGSSNYTLQYSYNPTDIVYGNSQSVIFYTESGRVITPTNYSFKSNTANIWSFYSSLDGKNWNRLSTDEKNKILNPEPGSWFKITVDAISNVTDGTVDISNVHINESELISWPSQNMATNSLFSNTILQDDSFTVKFAYPQISSSS